MAVLLTSESRILAVGASGPYGSAQIAFMRSAGSTVVAAAVLGSGGTTTGELPTFDDVGEAVAASGADAAMIYTPAAGVKQVVMDCADAGIGLAVVAAEFVPVHDALYAVAYARERGMTIVGPNTAGMSSPGQAMLGAIAPSFTCPGDVGLIGRSGTLTMTIARLLSARSIGQSTIVHLGGDSIVGMNPAEWLRLFLADPATAVVVYVGEIGGTKEYEMLDAIAAADKPVVTMIVGRHAPPGKRMGHAGALIGGDREGAEAKLHALSAAGASVSRSPYELVRRIEEARAACAASPRVRSVA